MRKGPSHINVGTYGRMDLPEIVSRFDASWVARRIDRERILYTDADVIFAGDVELREFNYTALPWARLGGWQELPQELLNGSSFPELQMVKAPFTANAAVHTFVAGTEVFNDRELNAGVMLINVSAARAEWPGMLRYARAKHFSWFLNDQQCTLRLRTPPTFLTCMSCL